MRSCSSCCDSEKKCKCAHTRRVEKSVVFVNFENEKGQTKSFSYAEVDYHISALALALKSEGIKKRDVVVCADRDLDPETFVARHCSRVLVSSENLRQAPLTLN